MDQVLDRVCDWRTTGLWEGAHLFPWSSKKEYGGKRKRKKGELIREKKILKCDSMCEWKVCLIEMGKSFRWFSLIGKVKVYQDLPVA